MNINVMQILSESLSFYKKNFKSLIKLSSIIFLFTISIQLATDLQSMLKEYPLWYSGLGFLLTAIGILSIVFLPKLTLAMPILINSLLSNKKMSVKQAYQQTTGKYWVFIGRSLLLILIFSLAAVISYAKIPFAFFISQLYLALVTPLFFAVTPMIAIEPKIRRYLTRSIKMVGRNYICVLILIFITSTIFTIFNSTIIHLIENKMMVFLLKTIYSILSLFISPFAGTTAVITYKKLKGNQKFS